MNKEELQALLHQEYKTENWKKITEFVFPNVSYLKRPQDIPFTNDKVESFKQIGNVKLTDGKNLAMFEVKVTKKVNLAGNRVELRKLVAPLIDQERNHGVLVIYEQGKEDYRFTFTAKSTEFDEEVGDFINRETDAKRFTYILGKNESCKTAADRFFQLATNKSNVDIKAVQDAFSVEKLSKQFFKEYKEHYENFVAYLISKPGYYKTIFKSDDKAIRDFVKLLLGRLVFIQFVQKKRWMGVPATTNGWHGGESDFLFNAFLKFKDKELFHSSFLEPLFYDTLNKPNRPNDIFKVTGSKVPYLNGGLFEKDVLDTSLVNFPASYFNDLLEFFDRYNFTINEYDPNEHEIGIDPEMLGSIFENLLEDNKDKGAFYTPKEIVHYMCQESLIEYLKMFLKNKNAWPIKDIEARSLELAIDAFVKKKEAGEIIDFDELLARALRDVKICDPAIGSGAFPMGLLNEIYHCVYVLYKASPDVVGEVWDMDTWAPDIVKMNIIQNSIYGVDIEKGAVDIARLRFWLSLIIDEPEPHALPNLDYKIVVGNSLVSKLDGDIIDIDWALNETSHGLFGADLANQKYDLLNNISKKQKEFFSPNSDKKKLAANIRILKIDLLITQLKLMVKTRGIESKPNDASRMLTKQTEIYLQTLGWIKLIKELQVLKTKPELPLLFFDWKLDFPEIVNPQVAQKLGFDIVIANPPYIDSETMVNTGNEDLRIFLSNKLPFCKGNWDIYIAFFDFSFSLLNNNGSLVFITPDKWISKPFGDELRKGLKDNFHSIAEAGRKVFENAKVDSIITFITKSPKSIIRINKFVKGEAINFSLVDKVSLIEPFAFDWLFSDFVEKIKSIDQFPRKLSVFALCENACATSDAYKIKDYLIDTKFDSEKHLKIINTGTIGRYVSKWGKREMTYLKDKYLEPVVNKIKFQKDFSNSYGTKSILPKLIIKGLTLLDGCFDKDGVIIPGKSTLVITKPKGKENELLFPLALINSKISLFYIKEKYRGSSYNQGINFNPDMLNNMPVPSISKETMQNIISITKQIIRDTELEKDTIELEQKLNCIFYKLYEFTYDEVKAIDKEFSLSKTEYQEIIFN